MSRTIAGLLALLLCAGTEVFPQNTAQVEGVVLDALTGHPITGVTVHPLSSFQSHATTKEDGKFVISGLRAGAYRLITTKDGYAPAKSSFRKTPGGEGITVSVAAGQVLKDVTIRLLAGGVVTGTILDTKGNPVEDANVRLEQRKLEFLRGYSEDVPRPAFFNARANDRGDFRFFGVTAGEYYLYVQPQGGPLMQQAVEAPVAIYYPGVDDISKARTIPVRSGEEQRLGIIPMPLARTVPVHIRVVNQAGEPPFFRSIQIDRSGLSTAARSYGGANAIEIPGLPAGNHFVAVSWEVAGGGAAFGQTIVQVGSDEVTAELVVRRGVRLQGKAVLGGAPLSNLVIELQPRPALAMSLQVLSRVTKNDGSFMIESVPTLEYQLVFDGLPPNTYVESATLNGRDVLAQNARVAEDGELNVVVAPSAGLIEGIVKNSKGEATPGAFVVLIPEPEQRAVEERYRVTGSDQDGKFVLSGAAPGRYKVFAWMELSGPDYLDGSFLEKFESHGVAVEAVRGKSSKLEIRLADEGAAQ